MLSIYTNFYYLPKCKFGDNFYKINLGHKTNAIVGNLKKAYKTDVEPYLDGIKVNLLQENINLLFLFLRDIIKHNYILLHKNDKTINFYIAILSSEDCFVNIRCPKNIDTTTKFFVLKAERPKIINFTYLKTKHLMHTSGIEFITNKEKKIIEYSFIEMPVDDKGVLNFYELNSIINKLHLLTKQKKEKKVIEELLIYAKFSKGIYLKTEVLTCAATFNFKYKARAEIKTNNNLYKVIIYEDLSDRDILNFISYFKEVFVVHKNNNLYIFNLKEDIEYVNVFLI